MDPLPLYIPILFVGCVVMVFAFLYFAVRKARGVFRAFMAALVMLLWLIVTGWLSYVGFFEDTTTQPPRLFIFVGFIMMVILSFLAMQRTREAIHQMPLTTLTYIHLVRIPIEVVLWWLFLHNWVPKEVTFEGANFDILAGLTAVYAALFLVGKRVRPIGAIIWNVLALGLLINVVVRAIRTTPFFIDPLLSTEVNQAVIYFPFTWLPLAVVPAVLFCHLASLSKLVARKVLSLAI